MMTNEGHTLNESEMLVPAGVLAVEYSFSFDHYRSERLPPPYNTMCKVYSIDGAASQSKRLENCVKHQSNSTFGWIPSDVNVYDNENYLMYSLTVSSLTGKRLNGSHEEFDRISQECKRKTRWVECIKTIFVPRLERKTFHTEAEILSTDFLSNFDLIRFFLLRPSRPLIVTKSRTVIELIDYVTYVLSSVSFWFAFSPLYFLTHSFLFKWVANKFGFSKKLSRQSCYSFIVQMKITRLEEKAVERDVRMAVLETEIETLKCLCP